MARRRTSPVPRELEERIQDALGGLDAAQRELAETPSSASRAERQVAHSRVTQAFLDADRLLREATRLARDHRHHRGFYRTGSRWRHELSRLDAARQVHLFAGGDELVLPLGTVRAIDTGMSGPAIGDMIHGHSREAGASASYGLDLERVLNPTPEPSEATEPVTEPAADEPRYDEPAEAA